MSEDAKADESPQAKGSLLTIHIPGLSDIGSALGQGGVLSALIGKTAAQALSELVGVTLSLPKAHIDAKIQRIKDESRGRSLVSDALSAAVAEAAVADSAQIERASVRLLGAAIKEQENLEAVAVAAAEELIESPSEHDKPIDEDFFARFSSQARSATSEDVRKLYGRILAGEIRKPGTFSLAALHVFSIMDKRLAADLERVAGWVVQGTIPHTEPFTGGEYLSALSTAQDLGLVRFQELQYTLEKAGVLQPLERLSGHSFVIKRPTEGPMRFKGWPVSTVGKEVFGVLIPAISDDDLKNLSLAWLKSTGAEQVLATQRDESSGENKLRIFNNVQPSTPTA